MGSSVNSSSVKFGGLIQKSSDDLSVSLTEISQITPIHAFATIPLKVIPYVVKSITFSETKPNTFIGHALPPRNGGRP
jgi:hypothetical protein